MSLFNELKRRNVLRMAAAYLAGSWLLLQIVETMLPIFNFDGAILRYFVIVLAIGFIPMMAVSWAFEWTPEGLQREQDASPKGEIAKTQAKTWDRVILVVMALALVFFAFDRFILSPEREAALIETAIETGVEMERAKVSEIAYESVAVLPFVNMSQDPANEYFSDGLTETLLHMLAQLTDLKVAARTSSFAFKDKNVDIRLIADDLGVAHVLEGSVQKANDRVRITAQLIRAEDGFHVWSQNYDRTLDDIFAIQDEIATKVADALGSALLARNNSAIVGLFTEDVDAFDIYLKALEQQAIGTFDSLSAADAFLKQALIADMSFLDAKIALVRNNFLKFYKGTGEFESTSIVSARLLSEILEENPGNLAARQLDIRLRSIIAGREMEMATYVDLMEALVPTFQEGFGDPFVRADVARYLVNESRTEEALQLVQDALIVDPLNAALLMGQGGLLWQTQGPDAAEQSYKTALKLNPDNAFVLWTLGILEINRKNIVQGLRYMRRVELVDPEDPAPTGEIALTFTELGMLETADRWLEDFKSRAQNWQQEVDKLVQAAAERNDEAALRKIVPAALEETLEAGAEDGISGVLLNEYAVIMLADDKAQEGLGFLESYYPGISVLGGDAVTGWTEMTIQARAVLPLSEGVHDEATNKRNVEAYLAKAAENGVTFAQGDPDFVWVQFELHGIEAGKKAFFSAFNEDLYILAGDWHHFKRRPWAAELRADPDVSAVMAARERRIAKIREEVLEMMKEPEWQE